MKDATLADVVDMEEAAARPAQPLAVHQPSSVSQPLASASLTTPVDLLRFALQSGADLDRLERLMKMQQEWEANEAKKSFRRAMAAFKAECPPIFKRKQVGYNTKDGDFVGYKHAELSDVTDVIVPHMAKHGLTHDWDIVQEPGKITVICIVTHIDGHIKKVSMEGPPDSSGKKNIMQQAGSTVTYLERYSLLACLGMSTKDEDDDGAGGADDGDDPKGTNTPAANTTRAAASTQQSDRPMYDQAKFDANAAEWKVVITSGRKTPAQLIALIETKGATLTGAQRDTIDSWSQK
jgi:hypothetical protein